LGKLSLLRIIIKQPIL